MKGTRRGEVDTLLFLRIALDEDDTDTLAGRALKVILSHLVEREGKQAPSKGFMGKLRGVVGIRTLGGDKVETGAVLLGRTLGVFLEKDMAQQCAKAIGALLATPAAKALAPESLALLQRLRSILISTATQHGLRRFMRFDVLPKSTTPATHPNPGPHPFAHGSPLAQHLGA